MRLRAVAGLVVPVVIAMAFICESTPARAETGECTTWTAQILNQTDATRFVSALLSGQDSLSDDPELICEQLRQSAAELEDAVDELALHQRFAEAHDRLVAYVADHPDSSSHLLAKVEEFRVWDAQERLPLVPAPAAKHLFTHSTIIQTRLAFDRDFESAGYDKWMVTTREFASILQQLYDRKYVLIDIRSLVAGSPGVALRQAEIRLPAGRTPLILSFDDVNYYTYMSKDGFAVNLTIDDDHEIASTYRDDTGKLNIGTQQDVVPMLEEFILQHPDFSWRGAKGIIAVTGYEGVLGYRTQPANKQTARYATDMADVREVVRLAKLRGWQFASHSYSHGSGWFDKTATIGAVRADVARWKAEVEPIVGQTRVFIGPFGTIWNDGDARRFALVAAGFDILCGVDAAQTIRVTKSSLTMGRLNVDGFRMKRTPALLAPFFDVRSTIDPARPR